MTEFRLISVDLEQDGNTKLGESVEQERKVAIFDLLEENYFEPLLMDQETSQGPFALNLAINEGQLSFAIKDTIKDAQSFVILSLTPFRQIIKDYFQICEAYFDAVKNLPPAQIEAIDMGRRGIHNEGAQLLKERLDGKIKIDDATARRLFTLISVLHFRG